MEDKAKKEDTRVSKLLLGCGRGRGKSPEFEFAARTILAKGCSSRAAKDNLLVGARLFLPPTSTLYLKLRFLRNVGFANNVRGYGMRRGCIA